MIKQSKKNETKQNFAFVGRGGGVWVWDIIWIKIITTLVSDSWSLNPACFSGHQAASTAFSSHAPRPILFMVFTSSSGWWHFRWYLFSIWEINYGRPFSSIIFYGIFLPFDFTNIAGEHGIYVNLNVDLQITLLNRFVITFWTLYCIFCNITIFP